MRQFATESGKSKGQFYTPAEVSRVIARVIGISPDNTKASTTAYDPTCRLGLIAAEGGSPSGQAHYARRAGEGRDHRGSGAHEHDPARLPHGQTFSRATPWPRPSSRKASTSAPTTMSSANPPFSDKTWMTGLTPSKDPFQRFAWGVAARQEGDYAYLLPHHPLNEGRRQSGLHPAPRRTLSRRCRGQDPPAARPHRLSQGHHWVGRQTSSTAPASPPASWCSTRRTPPAARASS